MFVPIVVTCSPNSGRFQTVIIHCHVRNAAATMWSGRCRHVPVLAVPRRGQAPVGLMEDLAEDRDLLTGCQRYFVWSHQCILVAFLLLQGLKWYKSQDDYHPPNSQAKDYMSEYQPKRVPRIRLSSFKTSSPIIGGARQLHITYIM
jgi:hypothetical protein